MSKFSGFTGAAAGAGAEGIAGGASAVISKAFNIIYMLIAMFACIMLFVLIILVMVNYAKIVGIKRKQNTTTKSNSVIIRNTMEYKLISYASRTPKFVFSKSCKSASSGGNESLLVIYPMITVVNILIITIAIFVSFVIAHILVSVSLYFIVLKKGGAMGASILSSLMPEINKMYLGIIIVVGIISISAYAILKSMFANKAMNEMYQLSREMYNLKRMVYENIYAERAFLDNLDSVDAVKGAISKVINYNTEKAYKMIYTFNLYSHYKNMFGASTDNRREFKKRFTYSGFKGKSSSFHPVEFLIYGKPHDFQQPDYFMDEISDVSDKRNKMLMTGYLNNRIRGVVIADFVRNKFSDLTLNALYFTKSRMETSYKAMYKLINTVFVAMFVVAVILMVAMFILVLIFKPSRNMILNAFRKNKTKVE
jgi:hypothetical protein